MKNRGLESYLHYHFEDDNAWLVYADWLLISGDKRGELIQLYQLANKSSTKNQMKLLGKIYQFYFDHYHYWLSDNINMVSKHILRTDTYIYWYYGFITEIFIKRGSYDTFSYFNLLLEEESIKFLRTLELRSDMEIAKFMDLVIKYNIHLHTLIIRMSGKIIDIIEIIFHILQKIILAEIHFVHPVLDIEEDPDLTQDDIEIYQEVYIYEMIENLQLLYDNRESFLSLKKINIYIPKKNIAKEGIKEVCAKFKQIKSNFHIISYEDDIYLNSFSIGYRDTVINQTVLMNHYITLPKNIQVQKVLEIIPMNTFIPYHDSDAKLLNTLVNNVIKIHSGYARYCIKVMQYMLDEQPGDYKKILLKTLEKIFRYGDNQDHYKILISLNTPSEEVVALVVKYIFPKSASNTYALDRLIALKVNYPFFIKELEKGLLKNENMNFRKHAAKALGYLGKLDREIITVLKIATQSDPEKLVREAAAEALKKLKDNSSFN